MAPRSKPLQPSKDERRLALARLFVEAVAPMLEAGESYSDLSVERMITAVDVSRSTFYSYFGDKGILLKAMGEDVTLDLAAAGSHWFDLRGNLEARQIRAALKYVFVTYRRHRAILNAVTEAAAYDPTIRQLHHDLVAQGIAGITSHIQAQQDAGFVSNRIDAERTALWLSWMLEAGSVSVRQSGEPPRDRQPARRRGGTDLARAVSERRRLT